MRVFKEEQRFTQLWLIVLLAISMVVPLVFISKSYINNQMSTISYVLVLLLIIVSTCGIFLFQLKTRIDERGIHYKFFPFHFKYKTIQWKNIGEAYVRKYDPISEYGGWGVKGGALWNKQNGIAYNVSGNIGIQLVLKEGKKILIGTKKEGEANQTINHYLKE